MRVAVLGGTGFIGHHVTRWLVESGQDVIAIHRGETPGRVPGARSLTADRQQPAAMASVLADAAPNVLIDMTAFTARDMERLLVVLPVSVELLVVVSSGDVYWTYGAFLGLDPARAPTVPLDEAASLRTRLYPYRARSKGPQDVLYWYEKILVERSAHTDAPVPVSVLRLPMVYGPRDPQHRVGGCLERLRASGSELRLNAAEAAWRCTRGYVEDVAWAIHLAALNAQSAGRIFNVGETQALTELEWVRSLAEGANWPGRIVADPAAPPSQAAGWAIPLEMDTRRIREVLGYQEPIGRAEGLRRTMVAGLLREPG